MKVVRITSAILLFLLFLGIFSACGRLNKTELEEVLNREYNPTGYTDASYQFYLKRYREAMDVYQSDNTTAYRIENATVNLLEAIEKLVPIADFSELLKELEEQISPLAYTNASYQVYKTVYDSAVIVASNELSKQSVVNNAVRNLRSAKKALVPKTDTSSLAQLLEKEYDSTDYTKSSYKVYESAAAAAKELMYEDGATESDIRLATNGLQQAIAALVPLGKTDQLQSLVTSVKQDYLGEYSGDLLTTQRYSETTLMALQAAYDTAVKTIDGRDSAQAAVDKVYSSLMEAVNSLVDKSSLYYVIARMDDYLPIQTKYTQASFDSYLFALTKAMNVNNLPDPSVQQILDAVRFVEEAEKALVRRPLDATGRTDFDLASGWVICHDCRVSLYGYFNDYAGFYNQIFESTAMIEQASAATFFLKNGYSVSIIPGYLSVTDVGRPEQDTSVTVLGVTFTMDEYAVGELLGAPTEYTAIGGKTTLVYEDDSAGIVAEFHFTHGKLESVLISTVIMPEI